MRPHGAGSVALDRGAADRMSVAALYVDPRGPYPRLVSDWYDEERDARTYAGPWPVVAHPPCGPWGRLRHLDRSGDPSLAELAVDQVRRWGGVLEHPAASKLWDALDLPRPGELPDVWGGRTMEVCQVDWGHVARKRTWLYFVRCSPGPRPPPREPTHWISGGRASSTRRSTSTPVPEGIKVCSSQQRRRTPVDFATWLLAAASRARPVLDEVPDEAASRAV